MVSRITILGRAGGIALLATGCLPAGESRPSVRPNVVVIVADDLGWGDVGYHGSRIETPNIDRLAREGVELDRFYTTPTCTPTRAALLTGRDPARFGLLWGALLPWSQDGLPPEERTLAEVFREAGYQTALVGKWHLGHARPELGPLAQGFDHFYGHLSGSVDHWDHTARGRPDWQRDGRPLEEEGYGTSLLGAEAVRRVRERDRDRPFLLVLAFSAPHVPLQAPPAQVARYAHLDGHARQVYAAMVSVLDAEVGRVLDALSQEDLDERTLVFFVSDNGGQQGSASNAPLRGYKGTTFEGGIRVPAAIRWPGVLPAGVRSAQRMRDADVLPTLAAAAGVALGAGPTLDGESVWPQLAGDTVRPRDVFRFGVFFPRRRAFFLAVSDGRWKLVQEVPLSGRPRTWLFDVQADPGETRDLARAHPEELARLAARLASLRRQRPGQAWLARYRPPPGLRDPADRAGTGGP